MNIPTFKVFLPPSEVLMPRLEEILYSGQISEGVPVVEFEHRFGQLIQCPDILSFNSGTAALHGALVLAGVRPGDEVISTAMTAEPTNMAILHAGAKIVWADVDPNNGNLTAESVAAKITSRTRAIMVVHYGGIPAPIDGIRAVANGIPVIEDAAHALGARYNNKPIGCHSEFVMFSLQAIKHMTTIDGGMLACNTFKGNANIKDLLAEGRKFRWFGIDRAAPRTEVDVSTVGYKYHMNNVTATIGLVQLDYIAPVIARHIANGKYFDQALQDIPGLSLCQWDAQAEPSYWFYTVLVKDREKFSRHLSANGIANSQAHKRNDLHSVFSSSRCNLPGLDAFYEKMIHIPCGWWVSDAQREFIVNVIRQGW
ncbi:MAG: DegT/DnrJ/EryC1/StrS family aminotransferase [Undibacterium sp.]|uniref:DegT/DnrJ/EryC1/StrS family aminotransferase n=1 Tax=Undibacterium sp. TaxID=1914977 RepID=UPI0027206490|nr:DegT/DnrJ/EryC1/StrS family aminotransferase [Undibacterium sp.]MDO8653792.1 DegT/DnrJ/EryC1/StrS family aminotransferase [Undibacterium sp.]